MSRPYSDARKKANQKWDAENLKRFSVSMRNDLYNSAKTAADSENKSMNRFVTDCVSEHIERKN